MKKILLLLSLTLIGCSGTGFKKSRTIVELTPKLVLQNNDPIIIDSSSLYSLESGSKEVSLTKSNIIARPILVGDFVYFIDARGNVSCFSISSRKIIWSQDVSDKPENNHLGGGIEYYQNKLYVTNGSRFLVILNSENGVEIIRKQFPDIIRIKPTILKNNIVLVQTVSNQVFGYDIGRASIVWQHETLSESISSNHHVSPIEYDNHLIVNYTSGQIFSINLANGTEEWLFNLSDSGNNIDLPSFNPIAIACDPIFDNGYLYVAGTIGKLTKLNLKNGNIVWQIDAQDVQSMSKIGNSLFITNNAKQAAAIDMNNGQVKWLADLYSTDKTKYQPASFLPPFATKDNDKVILNIVNNHGEMFTFALDNDGALPNLPIIQKIVKNVKYLINNGDVNSIYLLTDKHIVYK